MSASHLSSTASRELRGSKLVRVCVGLMQERGWTDLLVALGALGFAMRLVLAHRSVGTNDIFYWERFAHQIADNGLIYQYVHDTSFNHPPLMGYLARVILWLAELTHTRFALIQKLPMIAADLGAGVLIWNVVTRRNGRLHGALAFAAYAWSPVAILVSSHQGNTDSLCAALILLAAVLSERGARFAAGAALGAAINVKLIPVFCVPALLLTGPRDLRSYVRFSLGLSLGAIPFLPVMAQAATEFHRNAIAYNSNQDNWGVVYLLRAVQFHPHLGAWAMAAAQAYQHLGRRLILISIALVSVALGPRRRADGYTLCALSLALFLVLAPGFGVQYLVHLCPVLFLASLTTGVVYSWVAGLFIAVVYSYFWDGSVPYRTMFWSAYPVPAQPFGVLAWGFLASFIVKTVLLDAGKQRTTSTRTSDAPGPHEASPLRERASSGPAADLIVANASTAQQP